MSLDIAHVSRGAIAGPLRTRSWIGQLCDWLERRPAALPLASLAVIALLVAVTAFFAARSGRYNVDAYSAMLAVELLEAPNTFDVKISAPGYPLLLTAISYVDPSLKAAVTCHGIKSPCPRIASFGSLIGLQYAVALTALLSALFMAYRLSGNRETALLALVLTFAGSRLGAYTASVGVMIWISAFAYLSLALSLEAHVRKSIVCALLAGLVAGLMSVFYPLAAVFSVALALSLALTFGQTSRAGKLGAGLAVLVGAIAIPIVVYATIPSYGAAATGRALLLQLSERIGYQPIDFSSWLASLVLPIPFFGGLLEFLFADDTNSYVKRSYEILAIAQSRDESPFLQYVTLIRTHVLANIPAYLATVPSLINRGMWGGADIVALVGVFHLRRLIAYATVDGRMSMLLIVLVPTSALLLANTMLSSDPAWSNPAMPFIWAFAIAYVVGRFPRKSSGEEAKAPPTEHPPPRR